MEDSANQSSSQATYTVVARRYRPRSFEQLIGQDHVAQALGKAIATGRVGHAYLFTGARGVGKTSTARIFAKALNLYEGMPIELADEIASAIDSGEDIDVIEIDGASNRGINEIRQLRANVNVRPSRARYKIYIIDEVHMLTKEAFNALLKTLEEPPAHVKFIFCTTDPDKIPITVLSRCQRFDFVPVKSEAIIQRLSEIASKEGFECEPEALSLLARRAAGSMRDSQSLLEQVMSFSVGKITTEQVHALLGIADESLLLTIVEALVQKNALQSIAAADAAIMGGADPGQLSEQLLNYLRDIMAVGVGGSTQLLKFAAPMNHARLQEIANSWGIQTVLSAIQILDESLVRMRASVSAGTLLEVALVQICQLQQLASIPALIAQLSNQPVAAGAPSSSSGAAQKKKPHDAVVSAHRVDSAQDVIAPSPQFESLTSALKSARATDSLENSASHSTENRVIAVAQTTNGTSDNEVADSRGRIDSQHEISATHQIQSETLRDAVNVQLNSHFEEDFSAASAVATLPSMVNLKANQTTQSAVTAQATEVLDSDTVPQEFANSQLGSSDAMRTWKQAAKSIEGLLSDYCTMVVAVEPTDGSMWRIIFPPGANQPRDYCEQPARKAQIAQSLARTLGRPIQLQFEIQPGAAPGPTAIQPSSSAERSKRMRELANHPLIKQVVEVLDGEIVKVIPPSRPSPPMTGNTTSSKPK